MRKRHLTQIKRLILLFYSDELFLQLERLESICLVKEIDCCCLLLLKVYRFDSDLVVL